MEFFNAIILGIVQGATEFIPVSSSGHLIVFRDILNIQVEYGLAFDAVLQLATTLAVLIYFWKDITKYILNFFKLITGKKNEDKEKKLLLAIIFGTIPAIIFGLLLEDSVDTIFRNSELVAYTLGIGAVIMYFSEKVAKNRSQIESGITLGLNAKRGLGIGLFQALALIPGMSRSGMTIAGGLFLGLNRVEATRFSFLLAFPILFGSGIKKLLDLGSEGLLNSIGIELFLGSIFAFGVGLLAIHFLIKFLKEHTLNVFVLYRIILAIALLIFI